MRINKEETAFLLIDVQEKLYPHISGHERLTKNLEILIQGLNILNIPSIVTQQYTKGLGMTIERICQALGELKYIEKTAFSSYDELRVKEELAALNKKFIIIAGIEAHVCVLQTTIDLLAAGYIPVVIADCVSSRKEKDKEVALQRMAKEGAIISTYESILFELLRYSGTPEFKAVSPLVK